MNKIKRLILAVLGVGVITAICYGMVSKTTNPLVNGNVTTSSTFPLNLNSYGVDSLSVTVIATTSTFQTNTFTDGQASTGSIVVTSTMGLTAVSATDYITILSTIPPTGTAYFSINGVPLYQGIQWILDSSSNTTAISIKQAINANIPGVTASTASFSTVNISVIMPGSGGNGYSLSQVGMATTTFQIAGGSLTANNFQSGKDSATLSINGVFVSWTGDISSSQTATNIQNAINTNTALKSIIIATCPATTNVVSATSTAVGTATNYIITSSTDSSLTIGGSTKTVLSNGSSIGQMFGGANSAITLFNGTTTVINSTTTAWNYPTGLAVLYTAANALPGLTTGTTYFAVPITPYSVSLASTSTGAFAGALVQITSSPIKTTADSFTLTPLALTGIPSYRWDVSNDGANWYPYAATSFGTAISSVTFSTFVSTGVVNTWDFGPVDYSWIRLNYVSTTTFGAVNIKAIPNGKGTRE